MDSAKMKDWQRGLLQWHAAVGDVGACHGDRRRSMPTPRFPLGSVAWQLHAIHYLLAAVSYVVSFALSFLICINGIVRIN